MKIRWLSYELTVPKKGVYGGGTEQVQRKKLQYLDGSEWKDVPIVMQHKEGKR